MVEVDFETKMKEICAAIREAGLNPYDPHLSN